MNNEAILSNIKSVTTAMSSMSAKIAIFIITALLLTSLPACSSSDSDTTTPPQNDNDTGSNGDDNGNSDDDQDEETSGLEDAKLLIEHNSTDEDTGFQGFFDGEPWNELVVTGPDEERILTASTRGGLFNFGLTELFFETSEPENDEVPIENVLARLAEGQYKGTGDFVDTETGSLSTLFSHSIPVGPELLSPEHEAEEVDPTNLVISWNPVSTDLGGDNVNIVAYQVIVEEAIESAFRQSVVSAEFSIYLPGDATQVSVPAEFMGDNKCYEYEVLAIEELGNQTLSSAEFETGEGCDSEESEEDETPQLRVAKLLIEHNATDKDTGFQAFADGDPWNQLTISDPNSNPVVMIQTEGGLNNFGLTELFFETSEPPNDEVSISEVIALLPEGDYLFTADLADGDSSSITATFTHTIPAPPQLTAPADGASDVDPDNAVISWEAVSQDIEGVDITIVGYQVIVERDEDEQEFPAGFTEPVFSVYMPASTTRVSVPKEFLESGESYAYEVLAIEQSGNQTISSAEFETQ